MSEQYEGPIVLHWRGLIPWGAEEKVEASIRRNLGDLDSPADLIFHMVPMTDAGYDGPTVFVCPFEDGDSFLCEYVEDAEWEEWKE